MPVNLAHLGSFRLIKEAELFLAFIVCGFKRVLNGPNTWGRQQVPHYHFVLKTRDDLIPDRDGSEWPNDAAAQEEATFVAQDLMRNQEAKRGSWRIEVRDQDLLPRTELLFAEIDQTIAHLPAELREPHILASRRIAAFSDAMLAVRKTLSEVMETLSRADAVMAVVVGKRGYHAPSD